MGIQKSGWLLIALFFFCGVAGVALFKKNKNTNISVSETKDEITVMAQFPDGKSKRVQDQLRTQLNLTDLPDLTHVEVKRYQTPDRHMRFYIKSKPGYVKLRMDKDENNIDAQAKMKQTGKIIGEALAE